MNEWKFQLRRKKRGDRCLIYGLYTVTNKPWGSLCGCVTPPPKRKKTHIVKRALQRQLLKELQQQAKKDE